MLSPDQAVDAAFKIGMHQHDGEVRPFAKWLAERWPHHVIEIGALHGGTATLFGHLATGRIVSVDLPDGEFGGHHHGFHTARCEERNRRLSEVFPRRYVGLIGDSHDPRMVSAVRGSLDRELADVLFIDGDHTLPGVTQDFEMYRQFVRPGGAIVFHDINDTPLHRQAGCVVSDLWKNLHGDKREFNIHSTWGGIGVIRAGVV